MVLIKNALANIKASKMRVFAAMIWIVLGITSVVIVASLGKGLESKIGEASSDVDKRTVTLEFFPTNTEMGSFLEPFSYQDIEFISFQKGIESLNTSGDVQDKKRSLWTEIFANDNTSTSNIRIYDKQKIQIEYGRTFGYEDEDRNVVIIGPKTAFDLFDSPEAAIGETITISEKLFEVIGIMDEKSVKKEVEEMGQEPGYVPVNAYNGISPSFGIESTVGLSAVSITILPGYDINQVAWSIVDELQRKNGTDNGFYNVKFNDEGLKELQELQGLISQFTTILTAISLSIGGIGIMNIMYISVTERRREIGIRRAIGAKPRNILTQFLIESIVITSLGGIVGIIVGVITSAVVSSIMPFKLVPTVESYFYAVGASMLIGVVFGIIPAIKASRLDPIKAIQG